MKKVTYYSVEEKKNNKGADKLYTYLFRYMCMNILRL